jgi:hypothetical protein
LIDASGSISASVPINGEIVPITNAPGPCPGAAPKHVSCATMPRERGHGFGLYALCTLKGGRRTWRRLARTIVSMPSPEDCEFFTADKLQLGWQVVRTDLIGSHSKSKGETHEQYQKRN